MLTVESQPAPGSNVSESFMLPEAVLISLKGIVEGAGPEAFDPFLDLQFLEVTFRVLHCTNRFVCENVIGLIKNLCLCRSATHSPELALVISEHIQFGLLNDWSEVRFGKAIES